jgi:hypothetical protein
LAAARPGAGGVAFVWVLGVYALIFGTLNMALALELRAALFGSVVEPEAETAGRRDGEQTSKIGPQPT